MPTRLRRPCTAVWLLAIAQVMLSISFAFLTPTFQGPDETQHVDMVVATGELHQWPLVGTRLLSRQVRDAQAIQQFRLMGSPREASDATPRSERPSFEELERDRPTAGSNHINQHPPLYYVLQNAVTGTVVTLSPVDLSAFDRTVLVMRAVGALLGGLVVLLVWWTATASGLDRRTAVLASAAPLAIPMFTFVQGSVSNDTLLTAATAGLTLSLAWVLRGDLSRRSWVRTGLFAGVAMLTKLFGLVTAPMVLAAVLLAPGTRRERLRFLAGSGAVAFVAGGWWWLRNLVVEGALQPEGLSYNRTPDPDPDVRTFLEGLDLRLWQGFYGRFGNLNTAIPRWVLVLLTVVVLGAAVWGAVRWVRRGPPLAERLPRNVVLVAAMPFVLIATAEVLRVAYRYTTLGRLAGLQGRYTYLGMVGIALLVGVGLAAVSRRAWVAVTFGGVVVVAQALSGYALLRQFWGRPGGSPTTSVRALWAWSPFDGLWTGTWLTLTALVLLAALVAVVRDGVRSDHTTAAPPDA